MMREEETRPLSRRTKTVLLCVLCFLLGSLAALAVVWQLMGQEGRTLLRANQLIEQRFVGDYAPEKTMDAALDAMVGSLGDRWSYYLTPDQAKQVREERRNSYVGIGITVSRDLEDGLKIRDVTPDSPAQEAGLTAGEIIRSVNDIAITPQTQEQAVQTIKGEENATVTLVVEGTDGARRTVEVVCRPIQKTSATYTMLDGQVGLVRIKNFYTGTADLIREGVQALQEQGAKALVFDVRSNPGGYVTEMTEALDFLLPEGTIFRSRAYNGKETTYSSDAACVDLPMAVVVNEDSYSAAEFFAAALQESAGAVVAGAQTSGKGYSQVLFGLPNGSAVGLSTARYYTGSGVSLIGTGLHPDPACTLDQQAQEQYLAGTLLPQEDTQLQQAIQALEDRM